ncbi:MAG: peptidase S9 family protein [Planctomycetaceae bacterium]|nr:peptidase S9 family protein [Planctomycetaceae bacterium]
MTRIAVLTLLLIAASSTRANELDDKKFELTDVFQLEWASDPQISPDGTRIVYVRNFMDIMSDKRRSNLWIINADGTDHRAITTGNGNAFSPKWSSDGGRLIYLSKTDESTQVYCRWMDDGQTAKLTNLTSSPSSLVWSPDGRSIAFAMLVESKPESFVKLPEKPEGADWAKPAKLIERVRYRADGLGYLKEGFHQLFVLSAEGGTPRQLTSGDFEHGAKPTWARNSQSLVFSANRHGEWELNPQREDIYEVSLAARSLKRLTDRVGPDVNPVVSPDGRRIAYVGFDDKFEGYQVDRLYVMERDGSGKRLVTESLDRDVQNAVWRKDGSGLFFQYDDHGDTKVGFVTLDGRVKRLAHHLGGTTIGRPYSGGSFTVSDDGLIAFTFSRPHHPSDVAVVGKDGSIHRLTTLNRDLLGHKELGQVEPISYESKFDGRKMQGWIVLPPGFDASKKYPLILEIHGGPFANYGDRFSAEIQLYAAEGYVVFYANPRGSTGYGKEFGNLIHHEYPGHDFDDLMSGVDAVIAKGYVDDSHLYVTGGSGGGVLTAWIVGKTERFRAAVSAKPVINWYSFALTSDAYPFFAKYWFPGFPWEKPDEYLRRSPLSLVGNVKTPTMLLTGEVDYRTPISESEQFYQALKLRGIDTALVRVPGASHGIAARPSHLISKVAHILQWFEEYSAEE